MALGKYPTDMAEKELADVLRESFDYDLWANRLWLPLLAPGEQEAELAVFKHILAASTVWVTRLEGTSLTAMPDVPATEDYLTELHRRWIAAFDRFKYGDVVAYRNTRGDSFTSCFGDIVRHVINHGTYHRGQLRGMCGLKGLPFPETDYIGFAFQRDGL